MTDGTGMARSREELAAAHALDAAAFPAQAVTAAARAARYAAEEALVLLGRAAGGDTGPVTLFVRYVVRERGLDPEAGRLLRALTDLARTVELGVRPVPPARAAAALGDATTVVDVVAAWVEKSLQVAYERRAQGSVRPPRRRR